MRGGTNNHRTIFKFIAPNFINRVTRESERRLRFRYKWTSNFASISIAGENPRKRAGKGKNILTKKLVESSIYESLKHSVTKQFKIAQTNSPKIMLITKINIIF